MKNKSPYLLSWRGCLVHGLLVPLCAFVFVILYKPFGIPEFLQIGSSSYTFNITILFCITLGSVGIMRLVLYLLRREIGRSHWLYLLWCLIELIVTSLFAALYLALMFQGERGYFELVGQSLCTLIAVCFFPYLTFALAYSLYDARHESEAEADPSTLVKFYDEYQKLRFVIASDAIVFIKSEENYVQIHYTSEGRLRKFVLRSSMRALEEVLARHGLVRCHRSYYVNPMHIKMLRKDSSGIVVAELSTEGFDPIPISRKYQEEITRLL